MRPASVEIPVHNFIHFLLAAGKASALTTLYCFRVYVRAWEDTLLYSEGRGPTLSGKGIGEPGLECWLVVRPLPHLDAPGGRLEGEEKVLALLLRQASWRFGLGAPERSPCVLSRRR